MLTTFIPAKFKTYFKELITDSINVRHLMKYERYHHGVNSYMLPRMSSDEVGAGEPDLPIPPKHLWPGYGKTIEEYLVQGERHADNMLSILKESGHEFKEGGRILDFGCAEGRMIRWLKEFAETSEIWGVDTRAECIFWCLQNLSPPFNFAVNTTLPHLPFEDSSFDLIYAGSVFSHIDDLAYTWLLELRRVLDVGGRLYITINDNHTINMLNESYADHWLTKLIYDSGYVNSDFGVFAINRNKATQVFYDRDYFCTMVRPVFELVCFNEGAYDTQTAVLLRKPARN